MIPKQWSPDVVNIGDQIANLTLAQAVQLSDYLETAHDIKKGGSTIEIQPPIPQPQPETTTQTEFSVVYEGVSDPAKKIQVIKVLREITGLGLKEAKDAAEQPPKVIREGLPKDAAEALAQKLRDAGANVTVK